MAPSSAGKHAACSNPSCGPGATRNAIDLGRREFLKDTLATAGLTGISVLGGCAMPFTQESADTIVTNGRIATLNPKQPTASAIAVRGGMIAAVGSAADVEGLRGPGTQEINAATGDTPCMIMHLYDRAWINRAGVRALGWTKDTPNMFGGAIERDASGNPTGLVVSTTSLASLVSVWLRIPRLPPEEQILSTRHFMREHNRLGVTSVVDAGGGGQNYPDNYAAIAKLAAD